MDEQSALEVLAHEVAGVLISVNRACLEATGCRNLEVTKPDYWRETDEDESEAPKPHDE